MRHGVDLHNARRLQIHRAIITKLLALIEHLVGILRLLHIVIEEHLLPLLIFLDLAEETGPQADDLRLTRLALLIILLEAASGSEVAHVGCGILLLRLFHAIAKIFGLVVLSRNVSLAIADALKCLLVLSRSRCHEGLVNLAAVFLFLNARVDEVIGALHILVGTRLKRKLEADVNFANLISR